MTTTFILIITSYYWFILTKRWLGISIRGCSWVFLIRMCWKAFPIMKTCLFWRVYHIIYHGSYNIIVFDSFKFHTLRSNYNSLDKTVCRSINKFSFCVIYTEIINFHSELKKSWIWIKKPISTQHELNHVTSLCTSHCRSWLESDKFNLVLYWLWFYVCVIQTIRYYCIYSCHGIINYN